MKITKEKIVEEFINIDNKAVLGYFYEEVFPLVDKYIKRNSGNRQDSEDVFQEALIILYEIIKKGKTDKIYYIDGFIIRICKNLWINNRKKSSRVVYLEEGIDFEDESLNQLTAIINEEIHLGFKELLNTFEPRRKQVLIHTYYDNLCMKEIAQKLNLANENSAKTFKYRSMQKLNCTMSAKPQYCELFKP